MKNCTVVAGIYLPLYDAHFVLDFLQDVYRDLLYTKEKEKERKGIKSHRSKVRKDDKHL